MKSIFAATAIAVACLSSVTANAMEFEARDDLLPRLETLTYVYPPADPRHYDGAARQPFPKSAPIATDRPKLIYLSGPIDKGDAERFQAFFERNWFYGQKIVLDSPGGNFLEALQIGAYLQELQDPSASDPAFFDFIVLEDQQCLSACALIMAMGGGIGTALIEQGGTVGFHMGILPDEQAESTAKVRDVMNLTYDIVYEYSRLIEDGWQSPLLLRESLKHRTFDSFYRLKGGMRSWQMDFIPIARPERAPTINQIGLDDGTVMRVCSALMYSSFDRMSEDAQRMIDGYGDYTPQLPTAAVRIKDVFDELGSDHITRTFPSESFDIVRCSLSRNAKGEIAIGIVEPSMPGNLAGTPECQGSSRVESWCATGPAPTHDLTVPLLADALGCSNATLLREVPDDVDNWLPGWLLRQAARSGIAKRDVNIRATPGLGTSPIATLKKGTEADILDCAITNDTQGVFFKIASWDTTGWVSARFLIEEGLFAFPVTN